MAGKGRVFDASDTMADAGRVEIVQCFPNTFRSGGFPGMGGAGDVVGMGIAEGGDMVFDGIAGLISGDVEAYDMAFSEFFDECYGLQALLFAEMTQGAKDDAHPDAGGFDAFGHSAVHGGHHLLGGEAFL
jgi:hypothetical protein